MGGLAKGEQERLLAASNADGGKSNATNPILALSALRIRSLAFFPSRQK
tara:strand:- start:1514 stop:1660 length:147 start_codon:yes stop_codon:yes gene_type:complete